MINITTDDLSDLKSIVEKKVSEKRFLHIISCAECALELAKKLLPNMTSEIYAAALLHDITKEMPISEHLRLLSEAKIILTEEDKRTEGVLHSFSAPIVVMRDFPKYATKEILSAIEKHTVGSDYMTLFDKIIFVSDYVEFTRKYDSCIKVRNYLFDGFSTLEYKEALERFEKACIMVVEETILALVRLGKAINSRIYLTENYLKNQKL